MAPEENPTQDDVDRKQKLKENMAKIRNLVEKRRLEDVPQEETPMHNIPSPSRFPIEAEEDIPSRKVEKSLEEPMERTREKPTGGATLTKEHETHKTPEKKVEPRTPPRPVPELRVPRTRTPQKPAPQHRLGPQIPKAPEVRDIKVAPIEKGPLFITQEKFFDAVKIVSDMNKLSQEIEVQIDELKRTLSEDGSTLSNLEDIISEVEGSVNGAKAIINP